MISTFVVWMAAKAAVLTAAAASEEGDGVRYDDKEEGECVSGFIGSAGILLSKHPFLRGHCRLRTQEEH